jgi:hypothetical protein
MMLHQETFPGHIAYRTLLPEDVDNLLVPVCLSSTHVSWGSVRLEPTWMNIGEAAAYATVQAIRANQPPAKIATDTLQRTLASRHVMISFFNDVDVSANDAWVRAAQYFGTKGFFAGYDALPDAPLTRAVALAWADGIQQLRRQKLDAAAFVRTVTIAEGQRSEPINRTGFLSMLGLPPAAGSTDGLPRKDALVILWQLLER